MLLPSPDRDPTLERPYSAEYNGSSIQIYDFEKILEIAKDHEAALYDYTDFPDPIDSLQISVEVKHLEDRPLLKLKSQIQLDDQSPMDSSWVATRFTDHFVSSEYDNEHSDHTRLPFVIRQDTFRNTFLALDQETGAEFILWINNDHGQVVITNNQSFECDDKEVSIKPPELNSISPEDHLLSLMKLTATTADFINAFVQINKAGHDVTGIPLNREYVIGRNDISSPGQAIAKLGTIGLKNMSLAPEPSKSETEKDLSNDQEAASEKTEVKEVITLEDVGGLEQVKIMLSGIAKSFNHPEVMKKWGAHRPQGVLLHGPPGTGKTMLAGALANQIGAEIVAIQSSDIYEKWLGTSEQHLKDIFKRAVESKTPTVLLFDEIDSIISITENPSSGGADSVRNSVADLFKLELDTLSNRNANVLVVATSNNIDRIDSSLMRSGRLDYKIAVPLPDVRARTEIIAGIVSKDMFEKDSELFTMYGELDIKSLAEQTDEFNGADIAEVFRRVRDAKAMKEITTGIESGAIQQQDILTEIRNFNRSL